MAQSNLNIRMDEETKREFDRVCQELGINMSIAINILAKKMIREKRIPFDVSIEPNATTYTAIESTRTRMDMHGPFDSVDALMEALNA